MLLAVISHMTPPGKNGFGNIVVSWVATYFITVFSFIGGKKNKYWSRQLAVSATTVFTS